MVDRGGRFQTRSARLAVSGRCDDGRSEFLLVTGRESGSDRDLVIDPSRHRQPYPHQGCRSTRRPTRLVQIAGPLASPTSRRSTLPGPFGNRLDVANCITIGLLPDVPAERVRFIGNGSVAGAKLAMLSRRMLDEVYSHSRADYLPGTDG